MEKIDGTKIRYGFKREWLFYILAFLIPVCVVTIAGASVGIEPFSDKAFLVSDVNAQFAAFYTYFKHTILSGENPLYSLSKTLGGDMAGFNGYYLQNPFALLLLLFPDDMIPAGIYWMETLQIGCMGLTGFMFLNLRREDEEKSISKLCVHLMCSMAYALMGYAMSYFTLPIYFCSLILMPIVMLGLKRYISNRNHYLLYIISLALTIWCNYYLGYMICIFCGLYFIKELLVGKNVQGFKQAVSSLFGFIIATVTAVLLDAFSLIPIVLSLAGEKSSPTGSIFSPRFLYGPKSFIKNLLPGTFTCGFTNLSAPYLYVGILTLAGCIIYVLRKEVAPLKERLINTAFVLLLILSTLISTSDVIWHAFNEPVGFAHRQAFIMAFCLILLSDEGYSSVSEHIPTAMVIVLASLQLIDLGYNSLSSMRAYRDLEMNDFSEYREYVSKMGEVIDDIKSKDGTLYRIEKDKEYNHNDAMLFDYAGLSHNSSCEKDYVREFMGRCGFRNQGIWSFYYQGNTTFLDSLLGVKYYVSRFDSTDKPYSLNNHNDTYYAYMNPYTLPLGFTVGEEYADTKLDSQDVFSNQNELAQASGGVSDIYTMADYSLVTDGLAESTEVTNGRNEKAGLNVKAPDECTLYTRTAKSTRAALDYEITIDRPCNLYCYFSAPAEQGCNLYVNDFPMEDYFSDYRWSVRRLGSFKTGDKVKVSLEATGEELRIYDAYFYMEDIDRLKSWYDNASSDKITLSKNDNAHYTGSINCKEDCILVFSLPYEKGMKITIDGDRAETFKIFDSLIAVRIGSGNHEIKLDYFPDGMKIGLILSVLAFLAVTIRIVLKKEQFEQKNS